MSVSLVPFGVEDLCLSCSVLCAGPLAARAGAVHQGLDAHDP